MALELGVGVSSPAQTVYYDGDEFSMSAGKSLQIRDNETGEIVNRLTVTVPNGKAWNTVRIYLTVIETDV